MHGIFKPISTIAAMVLASVLTGAGHGAQDYYAVAGVARDDALNVRSAPDAGAAVIGVLAHDAAPVEIVRTENGWGMFPAGEISGWVSMRFLRPVDPPRIAGTPIPEGLRCVGTEPFWSATLESHGASLTHQVWEGVRASALAGAALSQNSSKTSAILLEHGVAVITPGQCWDGMSDAEFGWAGYFVLAGPEGHSVLNGCCALPAPIRR